MPSPPFPFTANLSRTVPSAPIIVVNIEQSRHTEYSAYITLERDAIAMSGISADGAKGSAPQMSARSPDITRALSAPAASICPRVIPRRVTRTPAPRSRFMDTYANPMGSSLTENAPVRSIPP